MAPLETCHPNGERGDFGASAAERSMSTAQEKGCAVRIVSRTGHHLPAATIISSITAMLMRLVSDSMTGLRSPTPWTWHPHWPGVTTAWLALANGVSTKTIDRWRRQTNPADVDLAIITAELGLKMCLLRPPRTVMPLWSRMAIADFAAQGVAYNELAIKFRCGRSTVWRCIKRWPGGFAALSGQRILTMQQLAPMASR